MSKDETLSELFARDPFSYTKEDIDRVIAEMRARRATFKMTGKPAKTDAKAVSLEDLGLI